MRFPRRVPKLSKNTPRNASLPSLERNAPSKKHRQTARASPIFFSDQYKIRFPVTKNPPSRNRKPCFVSPRRQPLCPFGHADVSPWPSAAQRPYVLMFLCPYVSYGFRVSGLCLSCTRDASPPLYLVLRACVRSHVHILPESNYLCTSCTLFLAASLEVLYLCAHY